MGIFNFLNSVAKNIPGVRDAEKKVKKKVEEETKKASAPIFNFLANTGKGIVDVANKTGRTVGNVANKDGKYLGGITQFIPGADQGIEEINRPNANVGDFVKAIGRTGYQSSEPGALEAFGGLTAASLTGKDVKLPGVQNQRPIQNQLGDAKTPLDKGLVLLSAGGLALGGAAGAKTLGKVAPIAGKAGAQAANDILTNPVLANERGYIGGTKATGFPEAQKAGAVGKGVDNKPRFEVDDSQAKFNLTKVRTPGATLGDVVDHPTLFVDYPQLANIKVKYDSDMAPKELGGFEPRTNTMTLNPSISKDKLENTILHETQHAIQGVENHASGGSIPDSVDFQSVVLPKNPQLNAVRDRLKQIQEMHFNDEYNAKPMAERAALNKEQLSLEDQINKTINKERYNQYASLAGEAEARNVGNRRNMTFEDRQAQPFNSTFDVKPQDQVVQYQNGQSSAIDAITPKREKPAELPRTPAIDKLTSALQEAKPNQKAIAKAQSQALGARSGAVDKILADNPGEKGFAMAKKAMQGPLLSEKPVLKQKLGQDDLNELFGQIQDHPTLRAFEKIRAYDALNKVFDGTTPQKNEIELLDNVFGSKFAKTVVDSNKTSGQKAREAITSVANVPRAIMSSFDFSAPFRQGLVLTVNHPVSAVKAGGHMFKSAFSSKVYNSWLDEVKSSPNYNRMKDSGLYLADAKGAAGTLADKEEAFMSNMAEKLPGIGHIVKSGERAYNGYLNKIRSDTFNSLADRYEATGQGSPENLKSLAKFINTATGRGNLGKLEKIAPELNTVFFAARNMASRLNMLDPRWYLKLEGPAQKEAIKSAGIVLATGLTTLSIAKAAGAEVNSDPRSTDFGKIKVGDQRYDIWGGFQQYARAATQLLSGEKNVQGDIQKADRLDTATKFVRSKLAPIPASVVDIAEGTNYVGEPVTVGGLAKKNFLPFGVQDATGAVENDGLAGAAGTLPSIFGIGTQNYSPSDSSRESGKKKKSRSKERY